ncbi:Uncharacterized protein dnm_059670 [Desulfonema magnum]|uniref:Uncharacterized protein n=1 Tax=Desulfonema magnum TaxID=45655 RepID=A0A975GRD0_9BACT|nr:Uncharacterized protein dnm_059670 [Desulfonema magnum]
MAPGFQYWVSCPGHFIIIPPIFGNLKLETGNWKLETGNWKFNII